MPGAAALRMVWRVLAWWLAAALALAAPGARAQGVELLTLQATPAEGALELEFAARVALPRAVDDALQKGVPIYFVAEATLLRNRWYWRDQRVARVSRSWRLAFQPLTGAWRVSLGGLHQSYASLEEALAAVSRSGGWRLVETERLDKDASYYLEFSYRLDSSQLPGPMQFGLGGGADWTVGVSRTLRIDP
jgi:hypothetical protein